MRRRKRFAEGGAGRSDRPAVTNLRPFVLPILILILSLASAHTHSCTRVYLAWRGWGGAKRVARVATVRAHTSTRESASIFPSRCPYTPSHPRTHVVPRSFGHPAHCSCALPPPSSPRATPFPSAPYCQEIFVTESRVVSLGEQATPKVSRLSGPAAPSIRATIIGQLKPGESVRVTCHPIIIRCPRGGSTTYPRDRAWVAVTTNSGNTVARVAACARGRGRRAAAGRREGEIGREHGWRRRARREGRRGVGSRSGRKGFAAEGQKESVRGRERGREGG